MKKLPLANFSFEFFPPKTLEGMHNLTDTALKLANKNPDFFSVTFGAGGSTRDGTLETLKLLQKRTSITVAPHLSCIGSDRMQLVELLQVYQSLGVSRIVALRGDLPSGMVANGEFKLACDLVKLIREETGDLFHIEVAAYPECHPQAKNALYDVFNLKKKYEAGANSAITQYFFNADAYFYFLDECAKQQIYMPIVPGIMPILQFSKLVRFSETCGAEIPRWLYKRLEAYGDDVESVQKFGIEVVSNLCQQLLQNGAPSLHFYTLNQANICLAIVNNLQDEKITLQESEVLMA